MQFRSSAARILANAILGGHLSERGIIQRVSKVLACKRSAWLQALAKKIISHFGRGTRPRRFRLERFILHQRTFTKACEKHFFILISRPPENPRMVPAAGPPQKWSVPAICTLGDLAKRLNLYPNELAWFADFRGLEAKLPEGPLRHYSYRWQAKRDGSARLVESPKQRLKAIQRYLLHQVLDHIPTHESVHGFVHGRSIRTFA